MQNFDSSMKQNKCERGKKMQVVIEIPMLWYTKVVTFRSDKIE